MKNPEPCHASEGVSAGHGLEPLRNQMRLQGGGSYSPRDDCTTGEGARDVTLSSSERRSCTWTPANLHKYIVFILPLLFGLKEKNKQ